MASEDKITAIVPLSQAKMPSSLVCTKYIIFSQQSPYKERERPLSLPFQASHCFCILFQKNDLFRVQKRKSLAE